ncbi:MAG: protein kinase [Thermoanaerobaculia bacterium]|nr:protein kinase [Thermoanaerobaculia bacterium]
MAIQLAIVLLVAVAAVVAAVFVVSSAQGDQAARREVTEDLGATQAVQTAFQQQRYQRLNLISRLFATDQVLNTYLAEAAEDREESAIQASIEEYQNLLTFDLGVVLDQSGQVLARTDGTQGVGGSLADTPLVAVALQDQKAAGVWRDQEQLYHAVAVPLLRDYELVGYTLVAYAINNALAAQVKRSGGADAVFFSAGATGPESIASTLATAEAGELVTALRRDGGDALDRTLNRGETVTDVGLDLGDRPWMASLSPLRDAAGDPVGAVATLTPLGAARAGYLRVLTAAGLTALAALVLGIAATVWLASRSTRPLALVAHATEEAAAGRWDIGMPDVPGDAGRISSGVASLLGRMREKRALETVVGRAARIQPESTTESEPQPPAATEGTVLAVELRRYADPKLGYDPDANLQRLQRDIGRIAASATGQKGRVVASAGHRVLCVFEGDLHAMRALTAATEISLTLAERESAFDEAQPPALALNVGNLVTGAFAVEDVTARIVAGLPVQLLDVLLREAHPGPIYFSKPAWNVLGQAFHDAGVEVKAQKPVLSTQPIYLVTPEESAKLTGARKMSESVSQVTGEVRTLADVRPGTMLGSRFAIKAELGLGPTGAVFKATDGEMADVVVLKLLRPEVIRDGTRFERLKQLVSRARGMRHPNVLSIYDFGEAERMPFVTSEFVRGLTLAQVLENAGRLPPLAVLRVARQMAWGLAAAHGHQVMHGALKPENVMIEGDGTVRVMDFGLSRAAGLLTSPQATLHYLAPEQLAEQDHDSRADFWSFGAIVFHALTGKPPLEGESLEALRLSSSSSPDVASAVSDAPPALVEVVARCLKINPDDRYPQVDQLLRTLEQVRV